MSTQQASADWREYYRSRTISAEEAASFVKDGNLIAFTLGREAFAIGLSIAARKNELKNVRVFIPWPGYDFGWYDPGWEDSFSISVAEATAANQDMLDQRRGDFEVGDLFVSTVSQRAEADIVLAEISAPDENGFCSFGNSLWNKKTHIKKGKLVIAEVNNRLTKTFGDNYVHVSEIDYFVIHVPLGGARTGTLAGRAPKEKESYLKDVAGHVSQLIKDGDTLQIGVGRTTEPLVKLGLLNGKHDLGWHSETTPPGVISLVREGVINGKCKTLHPGKVVVTALGGADREELQWAADNPLIWLVDVEYLYRTVPLNDNMVAINNALLVDIGGQICAETIGNRILATAGGQPAFVFGTHLSKGGRSITVLPSTAQTPNGTVSRIVPVPEPGTVVTIPRSLADYVVTEYGVASLKGKSLKKRSEELIAVAHPDFRPELTKAARRLFWP